MRSLLITGKVESVNAHLSYRSTLASLPQSQSLPLPTLSESGSRSESYHDRRQAQVAYWFGPDSVVSIVIYICISFFNFFFCSPRAMSPLPASLPQSASQSPLNGNALTRYNNKCLPSLDIQCAISRRTVQTTLRLTRSEQKYSKTPYKNTKSYLLKTEKHITKKVLKLFFYCDKTKSTK